MSKSDKDVKASVMWAVVILAALGLVIFCLLPAKAPESAGVSGGATGEQAAGHRRVAPRKSRRELVRGIRNRKGVNPRREFARTLDRRGHKKAWTCKVRSRGELDRKLVFIWKEGKVDKEHVEQLKKAKDFVRQLQHHGFEKLVLREGRKILWSKDLRQ